MLSWDLLSSDIQCFFKSNCCIASASFACRKVRSFGAAGEECNIHPGCLAAARSNGKVQGPAVAQLVQLLTIWSHFARFDLISFADLMKLFVMFPELSDPQALRLFTRHVQAILRGSHLESFSLKVFILSLCHLHEKSLSMIQLQRILRFDQVASSPEAIWCDRGHTSRTNETDK